MRNRRGIRLIAQNDADGLWFWRCQLCYRSQRAGFPTRDDALADYIGHERNPVHLEKQREHEGVDRLVADRLP